MMWRRLLLGIFLFHLSLSQSPGVQYVLLVPSVLQGGTFSKACAQLSNLPEHVFLNVSLNYAKVQTKIFEENVTGKNFFKCVSFKVPWAHFNPLGFITYSATGATLKLGERRSVAIRPKENVVLLQINKPIYKPGDKVIYRVVSLDINLKTVKELYPVIFLQDPHGNRVQQRVNARSSRGILEGYFQLTLEPIFGQYRIFVESLSGEKIHKSFHVNKHVLPKFRITVDAPATILVADPEFKINVCALYNHGQPVEGNIQLSVCRSYIFHPICLTAVTSRCKNFTHQLGKDGCFSQVVDTGAFDLNRRGYSRYLHMDTLVTETGTGVQHARITSIYIESSMVRISFENMDKTYKQGLPYFGQIQLLHLDYSPIPNQVVQLHLKNKIVGNYTTDVNGIAQFSLDTSEMTWPNMTLEATYKTNEHCHAPGWVLPYYPKAEFLVHRFYSKSSSFLKIIPMTERLKCNQKNHVTVHYLMNTDNLQDKAYTATFNYLVIAKGVIVLHGQYKAQISDNAKTGTFSISIEVSIKLFPSAVMLVYSLHPGAEMMADSTRLKMKKCFNNKVDLNFSEEKGLPGSSISLQVSAAPNSLCALLALDQSILLHRAHDQLSEQSIYNHLYPRDLSGYNYRDHNLEDGQKGPCLDAQILYNGIYYEPASTDFGEDAYDLVKAMGLKVFTNSHLRKPVVCKNSRYRYDGQSYSGINSEAAAHSQTSEIAKSYTETLRTSFPEAWVWKLVTTDSTGVAKIPLTVPHTITQWNANGFCINDRAGFGISESTFFNVFQPFFVDLILPFSVVQGETFTLKANVFNYMKRCIQICTILEASSTFQATPVSTGDENHCTCANEKKSYAWLVTPQTLGTVNLTISTETLQINNCGSGSPMASDTAWSDIQIKPLLVEPEGIEREITQGSLICTHDSKVSQPVVLTLPENTVKDSARVYWSVLGDILGSTMQKTQNLLRKSFFHGEKTLVLFTPTIHFFNYLNQTQQMTEEMESEGIAFLSQGYQKELPYKRSDGSYSISGRHDEPGNTWITAFVYKSLAQAKRYIYIDDKVQSQTLVWLLNIQKSDGCFPYLGTIFNKNLKREDHELSLTAHVTAALMEAGHPVSFEAVQKGLQCLEATWKKRAITTYEQALLAYTFGLASQEDKRAFFFNELSKKAKEEGGSIHWDAEEIIYWVEPILFSRTSLAHVETTCYGLLALLHKPQLTSEELTYASQIVRWVAKQQNTYGGFGFMTDTAVAFQALTQYESLTFTKNRQNSVRIFKDQTFSKSFRVNDRNRLLLQQIPLPTTEGRYTVEVSGKGCVYVQSSLKYNIMLPRKSSGFSLSVKTANAICRGLSDTKFDLIISASILYFVLFKKSYYGKHKTSHMAVMDVKMLSGFVPEISSIEQGQVNVKMQDVEIKSPHVYFYLENVTQKTIQFSFSIQQEVLVSNIKPASIQLYDYYETGVLWLPFDPFGVNFCIR
ncbi:ovostatin-like isoform X2 [Dasypus novemcinctus]|uniref:ovostatin-like isoform X2 n=1 Tax=Dasypus novemcinctus TaxID=9361 RepID=UPI00265FA2E6|nr:ovostatin-like isoform X2 [Dasypus novemcinctus]